ncbi:hypothetical protein STRDD10_00983 [Streptococcus sp. DD10]|uniref:LytTR family DNA-binding domain-containing protein n=1 Tax=Streptococcus sp. DD10 TaxID=1777878 RepID=UPI000791A051|nr:LytTR family transcriptional regulator DNA-binding domain-containing protein [Streptococcus sp. DD10]KXT74396.1 hypothetical protein STRDD10_00983 [Streptococcus sp. DD10]
MDIKVHIDTSISKECITIEAPVRSQQIEQVLDFLHHLENADKLVVKKDGESYAITVSEFERIYIENRKLVLERGGLLYNSNLRLYEVIKCLPKTFLQISQSEIINTQMIRLLKQTPNGMVHIFLKNGAETYSSRRYLKTIKEKLSL